MKLSTNEFVHPRWFKEEDAIQNGLNLLKCHQVEEATSISNDEPECEPLSPSKAKKAALNDADLFAFFKQIQKHSEGNILKHEFAKAQLKHVAEILADSQEIYPHAKSKGRPKAEKRIKCKIEKGGVQKQKQKQNQKQKQKQKQIHEENEGKQELEQEQNQNQDQNQNQNQEETQDENEGDEDFTLSKPHSQSAVVCFRLITVDFKTKY